MPVGRGGEGESLFLIIGLITSGCSGSDDSHTPPQNRVDLRELPKLSLSVSVHFDNHTGVYYLTTLLFLELKLRLLLPTDEFSVSCPSPLGKVFRGLLYTGRTIPSLPP